MNEVEKMYKNANVKKDWNSTPYGGIEEYYPPFTAEKQLGLIKWLANKFSFFAIQYDFQQWSSSNRLITGFYQNSLGESIADYINSLWQDLTFVKLMELHFTKDLIVGNYLQSYDGDLVKRWHDRKTFLKLLNNILYYTNEFPRVRLMKKAIKNAKWDIEEINK